MIQNVSGLRVPVSEMSGLAPGFQATVKLKAGPVAPKSTQALDVTYRGEMGVFRVSAVTCRPNRVHGKLIYGTASSFELRRIVLPMVAYVPGNCGLYLQPQDPGPLAEDIVINVSCVRVGGLSAPQIVRTFHDFAAGTGEFPPSGVRFTALVASTVTVEGIPVALAANESIRVTSPSELTLGSGILEHDL